MSTVKQEFCSKLFPLVFECMGTAMLTCIYQSGASQGSLFMVWLGFFVLIVLSAPISGSHYNPAITMAFMLRKDAGRFPRMLGLFYICAQFAGAFLGGVLIYNIFQARYGIGIIRGTDSTYWSQAMFHETIGSVVLTFLYLSQTEKKYHLAKDPAIKMLLVSAAYMVGMILGTDVTEVYFSPLNPAIACALVFYIITVGNFKANGAFIQCTFPFLGALIAVLSYEFIFKKTIDAIEDAGLAQHEEETEVMPRRESFVAQPNYNQAPAEEWKDPNTTQPAQTQSLIQADHEGQQTAQPAQPQYYAQNTSRIQVEEDAGDEMTQVLLAPVGQRHSFKEDALLQNSQGPFS